jgi:hypothetical protein
MTLKFHKNRFSEHCNDGNILGINILIFAAKIDPLIVLRNMANKNIEEASIEQKIRRPARMRLTLDILGKLVAAKHPD